MNHRIFVGPGLALCLTVTQAVAGMIAIGTDGMGPVQLYLTSAIDSGPTGTFGPNDGTASAPDGSGGLFVAEPGADSSVIGDYDGSGMLLSSFEFIAPSDVNPYASYVIDMSWGAGGTMWLTTFDGTVYNLTPSGDVLSSFSTGTTAPGITFDGTDLYTDSGLDSGSPSPFIYQMDTSGNILNVVDTGLFDTLGLAIDPTGFWVGGVDVLAQVDFSGDMMNEYAVDGTHYGVETTDEFAPEPSSLLLLLIGGSAFALWKLRSHARAILSAATVLAAAGAHASVSISSVTPSLASPQAVGTSITFMVSASDTDSGPLRYQYKVRPTTGSASYSMLSDFSPVTTVSWTPADTEGTYELQVTVMNRTTLSSQTQTVFYTVTSRVVGGTPVVNTTNHPLVALYSAPACSPTSQMRVRFKLPSDVSWQSTQVKQCNAGTSMNFYIAGMRASSQYQIRHDVLTGPQIVSGPTLTFTTGSIPIHLSQTLALKPLQAPSSMTEPITFLMGLTDLGDYPFAVDAGLNVVWYAPSVGDVYVTRPVPGGGYLAIFGYTTNLATSGFHQYDVAGNLVKETNVERVNDELAAMSSGFTINTFHHEVRELPNGNYLALAMTEKTNTPQGENVDVAGDVILVMDSNLQVLWAWNSFDHLDVSRPAVLGETCTSGVNNCILFLNTIANDWLHGNSLALAPDGNLLYSARHQDWVFKIDYQNGAGDGHVIWRLGKNGDFTWNSSDPWPWFSHQHDADYPASTTISLFDDGNTRVAANGGNSRGQALLVNEQNMTVNFSLNVDVGSYSFALGSAQKLINGNYVFDSGIISSGTQVSEWTPSGVAVSNVWAKSMTNYRAFRLSSLFAASY